MPRTWNKNSNFKIYKNKLLEIWRNIFSFPNNLPQSYLRMDECIKAEYLQDPDYNVEQEFKTSFIWCSSGKFKFGQSLSENSNHALYQEENPHRGLLSLQNYQN